MPTRLTKDFTLEEFACHCQSPGCTNLINPDLIYKIQKLRDLCGFPLSITSGYRCRLHNTAVGGATNSKHMSGVAADISWVNKTPEEKHLMLRHALSLFKGIGLHKQFLHVDTREIPTVWFY